MLKRTNLHPYQLRAAEFIQQNKSAALWIDMGLGKTVSTLTALSDMLEAGEVKRALVIAPLRVAQHTWPSEVENWQHLKHLELCVLAGKPQAARLAGLKSSAPIHIINRENIPWLVDTLGTKSWAYDCVVIDESSSFKNSSSKRWRAMRKILGGVSRMIQLTGTPAPNSLIELWPQIYLLDRGKRLENTKGKFLEKYCRQVGNPSWAQYEVKPDRVPAIYKAVEDVVLRMGAAEYLDLPDRVDSQVVVQLPGPAKKAYEQMERDFLIQVDEGEILAVNAAVQINKLLQVGNGAVYNEDGGWSELHTAKLTALQEIIDTAQEPVLVAYHYKSDLARITKALGSKNVQVLDKNPRTIDQWNAGKIPVLLAHPASAGHGLNLQKGGNVIVWFGLSWSLELYQQFNARLHRQGQTKPVRIHHILADTPADRGVFEVLQGKAETQNNLLQHFIDKISNAKKKLR
jgi:SNF2 family DNA or RNA helicase